MDKHQLFRHVGLTVSATPKDQRAETRRSPAEDIADRELHETMQEMSEKERRGTWEVFTDPASSSQLQDDSRRHLIFRKHHYMPTMTRKPGHVTDKGQIEAGAYHPHPRGGIVDRSKDKGTQN